MIIKLYKDATPRIGVVYPSEYQAGKAYEQITQLHTGEIFHASIELIRGLITLTLKSVTGSGKIVYKDLEFKTEQLKRLQAFCKPDTKMDFIHVFKKGDGYFIPKVRFKAPELLKLNGYEIVY
ncbi:MAG: hypothetical protein K0Q95_1259 [Bacteroidota bacterium]|jgi:hypothetical protein|nr:hypothetical protein [Bacteroidota bacterium]